MTKDTNQILLNDRKWVRWTALVLLASAMLGQTLNLIAHEREASFVIVVFTSVIFLFLSGLCRTPAGGIPWPTAVSPVRRHFSTCLCFS